MVRVKDAQKSLDFYQKTMGMRLLRTSENKDAGFNLYFLGYGPPASENSANGVNPVADREGLLELTWNYGTEKDDGFKYHDGNAQPQGFGHICVSVDDLDAACEKFESSGVSWKKRLTEGRMKDVAFVLGESKVDTLQAGRQTDSCQTLMDTGSRSFRTRSSRSAQTGRHVESVISRQMKSFKTWELFSHVFAQSKTTSCLSFRCIIPWWAFCRRWQSSS